MGHGVVPARRSRRHDRRGPRLVRGLVDGAAAPELVALPLDDAPLSALRRRGLGDAFDPDESRELAVTHVTTYQQVLDIRLEIGDRRRSTIPMPWMPWQREMLAAYLLPPELPAPQLQELAGYAMSFAERQDLDLIETLQDVNRTLFRDWTYQPGIATVETTPWEVYVNRRGVCRDFANLLICVARLLGVPAR
jgi:transglutaminase-like putative cysteine protease